MKSLNYRMTSKDMWDKGEKLTYGHFFKTVLKILEIPNI